MRVAVQEPADSGGERLLIRGGTTSVGLAAAAIVKGRGIKVVSTTRNAAREGLLRESGAEDVVVDTGAIVEEVRRRYPDGVDKVLELIGVTTLEDSLSARGRVGLCA